MPLYKGVSRSVIDIFFSTSLTLFLKREFQVGKHTSPSRKACIPKSESMHSRVGKHSFGSGKALTLGAQNIDFRALKALTLDTQSNALEVTEHCFRCYGALLRRLQSIALYRYGALLYMVRSTAPYGTEHCFYWKDGWADPKGALNVRSTLLARRALHAALQLYPCEAL